MAWLTTRMPTETQLHQTSSLRPKVQHSPERWGYLAEPAATNLYLQSTDLANVATTAVRCTPTANSTAGPDGLTTIAKLTEDATAAATHGVLQSFTKAASAIQYTASIYAKQGTRTWLYLQCDDGTTNGVQAWINLATGALGSVTGMGTPFTSLSSTVSTAANGFYRLSVTFTTNVATTLRVISSLSTGARRIQTAKRKADS